MRFIQSVNQRVFGLRGFGEGCDWRKRNWLSCIPFLEAKIAVSLVSNYSKTDKAASIFHIVRSQCFFPGVGLKSPYQASDMPWPRFREVSLVKAAARLSLTGSALP